ncbi:MAG: hypothetical protein V3T86_02140 [Planctomycetota bacterium]
MKWERVFYAAAAIILAVAAIQWIRLELDRAAYKRAASSPEVTAASSPEELAGLVYEAIKSGDPALLKPILPKVADEREWLAAELEQATLKASMLVDTRGISDEETTVRISQRELDTGQLDPGTGVLIRVYQLRRRLARTREQPCDPSKGIAGSFDRDLQELQTHDWRVPDDPDVKLTKEGPDRAALELPINTHRKDLQAYFGVMCKKTSRGWVLSYLHLAKRPGSRLAFRNNSHGTVIGHDRDSGSAPSAVIGPVPGSSSN